MYTSGGGDSTRTNEPAFLIEQTRTFSSSPSMNSGFKQSGLQACLLHSDHCRRSNGTLDCFDSFFASYRARIVCPSDLAADCRDARERP